MTCPFALREGQEALGLSTIATIKTTGTIGAELKPSCSQLPSAAPPSKVVSIPSSASPSVMLLCNHFKSKVLLRTFFFSLKKATFRDLKIGTACSRVWGERAKSSHCSSFRQTPLAWLTCTRRNNDEQTQQPQHIGKKMNWEKK